MSSPFLALPPEIRNTIFSYLVPKPSDRIGFRCKKGRSGKIRAYTLQHNELARHDRGRRIYGAILQVSKQTNEDCKALMDWSQFEFVFDVNALKKELGPFLRSAAPLLSTPLYKFMTPFNFMKKLKIQFNPFQDSHDLAECLGMLRDYDNKISLTSLSLELHDEHYSMWNDGSRKVLGQTISGDWLRFRSPKSSTHDNLISEALAHDMWGVVQASWSGQRTATAGIAEKLHAGLGGELGVEDTLCWLDGIQVGHVPEPEQD